MYQVNRIKSNKQAYLPLLLLSGKSKEFLEQALENTELYVLSSGQIPVCAAMIQLKEDRCQILAIATEEGHRAQGFAARLVNDIKEDVMRKVSYLQIEVPKEHALPFYRLGFHSEDDAISPMVMIKDLKELD